MNTPLLNIHGRQWPLYALFEVDYKNIVDTGVGIPIHLPPGAVIIDGGIDVLVASDATTAQLAIGDVTNPSRYQSNTNLKTVARSPFDLTDYEDLTGLDMLMTPTITGTATTGKFRLFVGYLIVNRANEAQTN